ncbi:hypothetical protein CSPX01_14206 [Colletotrichum filicis]|nr:hypothetical protein CSPX01_14206 [Colletotrichum filicis]
MPTLEKKDSGVAWAWPYSVLPIRCSLTDPVGPTRRNPTKTKYPSTAVVLGDRVIARRPLEVVGYISPYLEVPRELVAPSVQRGSAQSPESRSPRVQSNLCSLLHRLVRAKDAKARPLLPELSALSALSLFFSPLLLAPHLANPPPPPPNLRGTSKEATGTLSFFAAQRLPSTKEAEQPERRQRPEPKRTIPNLTFPPLPPLPIFSSSHRFFSSSPSLSPSCALLSSIFIIVLPKCPRATPRADLIARPLPALSSQRSLLDFQPSASRATTFVLRHLASKPACCCSAFFSNPNSVRLRLARNCDPRSLPARPHLLIC